MAVGTFGFLQDLHRDIVGIINQDGIVVESYQYSPDGVRTVTRLDESTCVDDVFATCPSSFGNPLGYVGAWRSPTTGLLHMRMREYSPHLRRFLSPDPLGYIDNMNLWAYVDGDPVNGWDPWGLLVLLGRRTVMDYHGVDVPFAHMFLIVIPDDQARFAGRDGFSQAGDGGPWYSVWDAFPDGRTGTLRPYGGNSFPKEGLGRRRDNGELHELHDHGFLSPEDRDRLDRLVEAEANDPATPPNYPNTDADNILIEKVEPPAGVSDTELIERMIESKADLDRRLASDPVPYPERLGTLSDHPDSANSNSYVGTLLTDAGVSPTWFNRGQPFTPMYATPRSHTYIPHPAAPHIPHPAAPHTISEGSQAP